MNSESLSLVRLFGCLFFISERWIIFNKICICFVSRDRPLYYGRFMFTGIIFHKLYFTFFSVIFQKFGIYFLFTLFWKSWFSFWLTNSCWKPNDCLVLRDLSAGIFMRGKIYWVIFFLLRCLWVYTEKNETFRWIYMQNWHLHYMHKTPSHNNEIKRAKNRFHIVHVSMTWTNERK